MALNANEQYLLELINRGRLDPTGEAARLGIDLNQGLRAGTISDAPKEILAPNDALQEAARVQGEWILESDVFDHAGPGGSNPGERMQDAGYVFTGTWAWRENLSWVGSNRTLNAAAAITEQYDNLFKSASHRVNTLATDAREVGLSQSLGRFTSGDTTYNASVVVENFAISGSRVFITGVTYSDSNRNDFYSIGEGLAGITYRLGGTSTTTTAAGGYVLGLEPSSSASVAILNGSTALGTVIVDASAGNVKLDMVQKAGIWTVEVAGDAELRSGLANARLLGISDWSLTGNSLDNQLTGNSGDNTLVGGGGKDTLIGGAGDDVYVVSSSGVRIVETATGGTDTLRSSVNVTLASNVENLVLLGSANLKGAGNALDNVITGNAGNNSMAGAAGNDTIFGGAGNDRINGGTGADLLIGGTGNDTYYIDNLGDVVRESADGGYDSVVSTIDHALGSNVEKLVLTGKADLKGAGNTLANVIMGNAGHNALAGGDGNDTISGGAGNDTVNGGTGADLMAGGAGNDIYYVDNKGDVVREKSNGGYDTVNSTVAYNLTSYVEKLVLTGSADVRGTGNTLANVIMGNSGHNVLVGGAGNDTISGGVGNDTIDGGTGIDLMAGGKGDDLYVVDHKSDVVRESANSGIDTVLSTADFRLGSNVENLTLRGSADLKGTGNTLANVINGNSGNNMLSGSAGNDTINGGAGNDTINGGTDADLMIGGAGNDTYYVDNVGDVVRESANAGLDTVIATIDHRLNSNVERLILSGSADLSGTGNSLDNAISGNSGHNLISGAAGNDTINGGAGNDTIIGGAGADQLTGGSGADVFRFADWTDSTTTAFDTITDFTRGTDIIDLSGIDANTLEAGDQSFTLIGTAGFDGTGAASAGQMRFEASGSRNVLVQMDLDGDGTADMHLLVAGNTLLGVDDFIF